MSSFPGSPRILKGGLVLMNAETSVVQRIIALQYNPDTLTRSFQVKSVGSADNNRSDALRLTGPPVETLKVDVEIDAIDQLEVADAVTIDVGIQPQLAVLEGLVYPNSRQLQSANRLASLGTLEIAPQETPLTLFVWNRNRIVPVRITELSITEEAFDINLNPIRAKVSLGMRVLSVDDLPFDHKGASLYLSYQQTKERMAGLFRAGTLNNLGLNTI